MKILQDHSDVEFLDCHAWHKRPVGKKIRYCYEEYMHVVKIKWWYQQKVYGPLFYKYLNGIKVTGALEKLQKAFGDNIIRMSTC